MTSSGLFSPIFVPVELREAVSDRAWLQAMLDFEGALAEAQAEAGVIPAEVAGAISRSASPWSAPRSPPPTASTT